MAKITPGSLAGHVSGSAGNVTFSHNRYGAYIRRRVIPTNPKSLRQLKIRAAFQDASTAWKALVLAKRLAWQSWAASNPVIDTLGNAQILQANAAFIQLTSRLTYLGIVAPTTPPVAATPTPLKTLVLTGDIGAGLVSVDFTPMPRPLGIGVYMRVAILQSPSISFVASDLSYFKRVSDSVIVPLDIQNDLELRYGTLLVGTQLIMEAAAFSWDDGQLSVPIRQQVAITTT